MDFDGRTDTFPTIITAANRLLRSRSVITVVGVMLALLALAGSHPTKTRSVAALHDEFDQDELVDELSSLEPDGTYDPHARDFTDRCMKLAKYSHEKACEVFMECCSEDYVLNKLNGDRCQTPNKNNGCTLKETGGVMWSLCQATNCTAEVTTTTTTTTLVPGRSAANSIRLPAAVGLVLAGFSGLLALQ